MWFLMNSDEIVQPDAWASVEKSQAGKASMEFHGASKVKFLYMVHLCFIWSPKNIQFHTQLWISTLTMTNDDTYWMYCITSKYIRNFLIVYVLTDSMFLKHYVMALRTKENSWSQVRLAILICITSSTSSCTWFLSTPFYWHVLVMIFHKCPY